MWQPKKGELMMIKNTWLLLLLLFTSALVADNNRQVLLEFEDTLTPHQNFGPTQRKIFTIKIDLKD